MKSVKLIDINFMTETSKLIEQKLTESAIKRELIETRSYTRSLGKTTALINFAKKYNLGVVIVTPELYCNALQKEYDYKNIFSIRNLDNLRGTSLEVVIDEMVDVDELLRNEIKVVTGFKYKS